MTVGIALAQLGMSDEGPLAMIAAAAAAGFGAVGLPLRSGALRSLRTEIVGHPGLIRDIRHACDASGITVFDIEALVLGHLPEPDELRRFFEAAAELGASRVSCLGHEPAKGPGAVASGGEAGALAALCATAAEYGLLVGVEFMAFRSIGSLGAAAEVVARSGAPNARIILDALHVQRTGGTADQIAALPPGLISHLQLCDAATEAPADLAGEARGGRLLPGGGVIPLAALIAALPPGTPLSLEIPVAALAGLPVAERARLGAASLAHLMTATEGALA